MLVRLQQAHKYRGKRTQHPRHPAIPNTIYANQSIVELDAVYFETYLEPYGFAVLHNAAAAAEDATVALLGGLSVDKLRALAADVGIAEELKGTGPGGRVEKGDLVTALRAHGEGIAQAAAAAAGASPGEATARQDELEQMGVAQLRKVAAKLDILDAIKGTGSGDRVLKGDLVAAIVAAEELGIKTMGASD